MVEKISETKYYRKTEAFTEPQYDICLKIVAKKEQGKKLYSLVFFGLCKDGITENRDEMINVPATRVHDFIERVQL